MYAPQRKSAALIAGIALIAASWAVRSASGSGHGGATTLHAGFVGTYAGQLSGGEALSALHAVDAGEEGHAEETLHDYRAADSSQHESLGSYGDHLSAHDFPQDFGSSAEGDAQYGEAVASATEEHGVVQEHHDFGGHDEDFDTKPVPGIDHGKGAFSYSSTYEFKDKPEEQLSW